MKHAETASRFTLATLRQRPDLEIRVADLFDLCRQRYTRGNLGNAVKGLLTLGLAGRSRDGNKSAWRAIGKKGIQE